MRIEALNESFGVPERIRFYAGPNEFPIVEINHEGSMAHVALHGAHVLAFTPKGERPVLWLSDAAVFQEGQALRGGIPVIWPWFGAHPSDAALKSHGFVRNNSWAVKRTAAVPGQPTEITLWREDDEHTRKVWPHTFRLELTVKVSQQLHVSLSVINPGPDTFTFTAALHSYFSVSDVGQIQITGLDDVTYLNKPTGFSPVRQAGPITFNGEVDRVYQATTAACHIIDPAWERRIKVAKRGSATTVVWNPGPDVVKGMADFPDTAYPDMVCVETANAHDERIVLAAGASHSLAAIISVEH